MTKVGFILDPSDEANVLTYELKKINPQRAFNSAH